MMTRTIVPVMLCGLLMACSAVPTRQQAAPSAVGAKATAASASSAAGVEVALARGIAAERSGDDDRAMLEYVGALQLDPRNVDIRVRIGAVYARVGDLSAARTAYTDALAVDPMHGAANEGLGLILLRQQAHDAARAHLERAVARQPAGRWRAFNGLGMVADLAGHTDKALAYYAAAIAQQPNNAALRNNLGYSKYLAGRYRMAEDDFLGALRLDQNYALAWANLALVRVRLGNASGGVEAFAEAMKPQQAYNNVGYLLYLQGSIGEAERYLEQAVALSPSYYEVAQQNLERVRVARQNAPGNPGL